MERRNRSLIELLQPVIKSKLSKIMLAVAVSKKQRKNPNHILISLRSALHNYCCIKWVFEEKINLIFKRTMLPALKQLSMEELVDLLAHKTQKFTQLLVEKEFTEEYKENKEAIQQILAEIELRKESQVGEDQTTRKTSAS
jgi:HD-like signal output (HDOD) protein